MYARQLQVTATLIVIMTCSLEYSGGQSFDFVQTPFEPMELEHKRRGTYQINYCLREMLNCWENVRMESICFGGQYREPIMFSSVCEPIRYYCRDFIWDTDQGVDNTWTGSAWPMYMSPYCGDDLQEP